MQAFLIVIGVVTWIAALVCFAGSKSAIHEILSAISFLIGLVGFIGAAALSKLEDIRTEATELRRRAGEQLPAIRAGIERLAQGSPPVLPTGPAEEVPAGGDVKPAGARWVTPT